MHTKPVVLYRCTYSLRLMSGTLKVAVLLRLDIQFNGS